MSKAIKFNDDARISIKKGIDVLANAVRVTLGPKGRTVIIDEVDGPRITKDGVSVAKSIELEDKFENVGAQIVKQVASKTCDDAGDGTTTATVLAQSIINNGLRLIAAGASPIEVKQGIDMRVADVVNYIKSISEQVNDDYNKIEQVATISANNDSEIGKLIAEAMKKVSRDGVITVEEAKGNETTIEVVEGMQFNRGYLSPYFVTDQDTMECVMDNPYIFIHDQKLDNIKDMLPILETCAGMHKPLLIITDDIDNETLTTFVVNRMRNGLKICVVRAPGFGEERLESLEDIAVLTNGTVFSKRKGMQLDKCNTDILGLAEKVVITKNTTTIIGGYGQTEEIQSRIESIKNTINNSNDSILINKCKNRLAKLIGGVAILRIGASSEVEMKEKKDRVDDALCATRAAIEEGIVSGGGSTYIHALSNLTYLSGTPDQISGMQIIEKALEEPLRRIAINAGKEPGVIVSECTNGYFDWGYDAKEDKFTNLKQIGIIDPAKVTRVALENAASVAGLFLTTECVIVNKD